MLKLSMRPRDKTYILSKYLDIFLHFIFRDEKQLCFVTLFLKLLKNILMMILTSKVISLTIGILEAYSILHYFIATCYKLIARLGNQLYIIFDDYLSNIILSWQYLYLTFYFYIISTINLAI